MTIFFQKNNKNSNALFGMIEAACEGLIYISETDAPVQPFAGGAVDALTREIILTQIASEPNAPIEEVDFDLFFAWPTQVQPWHGEPEKARAEKFLELKKLLEENLRDRKVFRT